MHDMRQGVKSHLEGVIDPPLQACESADHDDTCAEAAPDTAEAKLVQDLPCSLVALFMNRCCNSEWT